MSKRYCIFFLLTAVAAVSCTDSHDEPKAPPEEVQPPADDNPPAAVELTLAEQINSWIYGEMDHYYLWREDIPDSSACDFTLTPREFYESILSPKDRFSYMDQKSSRSDGQPNDYGFEYQEYQSYAGQRLLQVLYVTAADAKRAGLRRGDFVRVDSANGQSIVLTRYKASDSGFLAEEEPIAYTTTSRAAINATVYTDSVYTSGDRSIGYICYLEFDESADLHQSFTKFQESSISDLILDLRYNPGGYVSTCKLLCNMIVTSTGYGQMFQQSSYNDIVAQENVERYGDERTYSYFRNSLPGPTLGQFYPMLGLEKLYVLVSSHTASASEATINGLWPYMEVVVIGETTIGKGVGMRPISTSEYVYELNPITFRYYNAEGETVPDSGLVPDYYVPDGYSTSKRELGDIDEPLLHQALMLIAPEMFPDEPVAGPDDPEPSSSRANSYLTPVGEPSYVTAFKHKHYNESD